LTRRLKRHKTRLVPRDDHAWIEELTARASPAHHEAVAELRDFLHRTLVRGFGHQLSPGDIEDVTQDSLLRVHQQIGGFQGRSRFTTWAASIAVHAAISTLRRRRYQHVSLDDAAEQGASALVADDPTSRWDGEEDVRVLRKGIEDALTDRQRQAIRSRRWTQSRWPRRRRCA
jgi:RNA polymerase sigma-70 factor, ECF subfamily